MKRLILFGLLGAIIEGIFYFGVFAHSVKAGCQPEPITPNTPTGIAGCVVFGEGVASHYAPGYMAAMNYCTWRYRHTYGCGSVMITSLQTHETAVVAVTDFCDCFTGTRDERVVDLGWDVVRALGLDLAQGLYPVIVEPVEMLPDTATDG